jgi:hypothetical protein
MALVIIGSTLVALIALDLAAWRWGYNSREPFESAEWDRRHR